MITIYAYQMGRIFGYIVDEYQVDTAGNPNKPIAFNK